MLHVIVGSGAVGGAVAELLADAGHTVRVVTRSGSGPEREGVERVTADATDADRLTTLTRGAVALYNCANPPYDKWLTDWPPLSSSLLTAASGVSSVMGPSTGPYPYRLPIVTRPAPVRSAAVSSDDASGGQSVSHLS